MEGKSYKSNRGETRIVGCNRRGVVETRGMGLGVELVGLEDPPIADQSWVDIVVGRVITVLLVSCSWFLVLILRVDFFRLWFFLALERAKPYPISTLLYACLLFCFSSSASPIMSLC